MPVLRFTTHLARHLPAPRLTVPGDTVRAALEAAFADDAILRSYVLDDQGRLRKYVNIYVDGRLIADRQQLSDPVGPRGEIYVLQALSGG